MERWYTTAKLAVLALFLAVTAWEIGYQVLYVWPAQKCDREGLWWDPKDRQCLTPIPIEKFTRGAFAGYKIMPASPPAPTAHPPAPGH
ncbi:MAG: hypothetical protein ACREEB_03445 [Caulobacteraceae bacterium]